MADQSPAQPPSPTYLAQLKEGDRHWPWQVGLRIIVCILDVVGIGSAAWLVANEPGFYLSYSSGLYYDDGLNEQPGMLAVMGASLLWCVIVLLNFLVIRPHRPVLPGLAVAFDLLLWLAFVALGILVIGSLSTLTTFASDGTIEDPSAGYSSSRDYSGHYELADNNNTMVFKITDTYDSSDYASTYPGYYWDDDAGEYVEGEPPEPEAVERDCTPSFSSCEEQDRVVNELYHSNEARKATTIITAVVAWAGVGFHFALFVWACVLTQRRNNGSNEKKYQEMAERIVQDMEKKGMITVHRRQEDEVPLAAPAPAHLGQDASRAASTNPSADVHGMGERSAREDPDTMMSTAGPSEPAEAHVGGGEAHAR